MNITTGGQDEECPLLQQTGEEELTRKIRHHVIDPHCGHLNLVTLEILAVQEQRAEKLKDRVEWAMKEMVDSQRTPTRWRRGRGVGRACTRVLENDLDYYKKSI